MSRDPFKYLIKKDGSEWKVAPETEDPNKRPIGGQALVWQFEDFSAGLEAHLQFCDSIEGGTGAVCIVDGVTADWTQSIPDQLGSTRLELTLREGVALNQSFYYAVWIKDPNGPDGFAIGDNPPPKIETGGGG